jgi:predicted nucleic-acid-binding protein
MRAVDTNVLVRLIAQDDARQAASAEQFIRQGAWVSVLVLVEAMRVLTAVYGRSAMETATAVRMLLDHEHLTLQDEPTIAAALDVFSSHPAVGFSDCLVLALARRAGHLPLGTFDRTLAKVDGAVKI